MLAPFMFSYYLKGKLQKSSILLIPDKFGDFLDSLYNLCEVMDR